MLNGDDLQKNVTWFLNRPIGNLHSSKILEWCIFLIKHPEPSYPHKVKKQRSSRLSNKRDFPFDVCERKSDMKLVRQTNADFIEFINIRSNEFWGDSADPNHEVDFFYEERRKNNDKLAAKFAKKKSADGKRLSHLSEKRKDRSRLKNSSPVDEFSSFDHAWRAIDARAKNLDRKIAKEINETKSAPPNITLKPQPKFVVGNVVVESLTHRNGEKIKKSGYTKSESLAYRQQLASQKAEKKLRRKQARESKVISESGRVLEAEDDYWETKDEWEQPNEPASEEEIAETMRKAKEHVERENEKSNENYKHRRRDSYNSFYFSKLNIMIRSALTVTGNVFSEEFDMTQYIVCLYQIFRSRSIVDTLAAMYAYDSFLGLSVLGAGALDLIVGFFHACWDEIQVWKSALIESESGEVVTEASVVQGLQQMLNSTLSSNLYMSVRELVLKIAAIKYFDNPLLAKMVGFFGSGKTDLLSAISSILQAVSNLMEMGSNWAKGKTFSEAFLTPDPLTALLNKGTELLPYAEYLYTGLPVAGRRDIVSFVGELKDVVDGLNDYKTSVGTYHSQYSLYKKITLECTLLYSRLLAEVGSGNRMVPAAVLNFGPPGIGKSYINRYVFVCWSQVKDREFKDSHIYNKNGNSKFWECYEPLSQPFITFSELGKKTAVRAGSTGDDELEEFLSLVDSNKYNVNTAFSSKGKIFANPELIVADTNNEDLNLDSLYKSPAAFRRRFIYIQAEVKGEFKQPNSHSIDHVKANQWNDNGGHPMDIYLWTMYRRPANKSKDKQMLCSRANLRDFTRILLQVFTEHIINNQKSHAHMESLQVCDTEESDVEHVEEEESEDEVSELEFKDEDGVQSEAGRVFNYAPNILVSDVSLWDKFVTESRISYSRSMSWITSEISSLVPEMAVVSKWSHKKILILITFIMLFCGFNWWNIFLFDLLFMAFAPSSIGAIIYAFIVYRFTDPLEHYKEKYRRISVSLSTGGIYNPKAFYSKHSLHIKLCLACITALSIYMKRSSLIDWFKECFGLSKLESESGQPAEIIMNMINEECGAGSELNRVRVDERVWNTVTPLPRVIHTNGIDSLYNKVRKNIRYVRIPYANGERQLQSYVLGIKGSCFLINKHSLVGQSEGVIRLSMTDGLHVNGQGFIDISFSEVNMTLVASDVMMVKALNVNFTDISSHFGDLFSSDTTEGLIEKENTRANILPEKELTVHDAHVGKIVLKGIVEYTYAKHASGKCGLPVVVNVGKGSQVVAIHSAGQEKTKNGFGVLIRRSALDTAYESLMGNFRIFSQVGICDFVLEDPGVKSALRYELLQNLTYHGKMPGPIILDSPSALRETRIKGDIESFFRNEYGMISKPFGRPLMRGKNVGGEWISPYNLALRGMNSSRKALSVVTLKRIVDALTRRIICGLEQQGVTEMKPLSVSEAINGVTDDSFVRRINAATSGGFGYPGLKSNYLPLVDDSGNRVPVESLMEDIYKSLHIYKEGRTCKFVYNARLKDEVRSMSNIVKGKTRVFYVSSLDSLIIARMFLMPFYTYMITCPELFCTAIGIDMPRNGHVLYSRLVDFGGEFLEGDYGSFDLGMPPAIGEAVANILANVVKHFGYNDAAMNYTCGILSDNLFPYVQVLNDVFCVPGLQPSGKFATAEDNSIRGLVMLMYAWIEGGFAEKCGDFFDYVLPVTYGDDVLASVREPSFNGIFYSRFCREHFNMPFTDSNKMDVMEPFVEKEKMSFLKRIFVSHGSEYFEGRHVACLEYETYIKSLSWTLPSNNVTETQQLKANCVSMLWEFALYKPQDYGKFRSFLIGSVSSAYLIGTSELERAFPSFYTVENSIMGRDNISDYELSSDEKTVTSLGEYGAPICTESDSATVLSREIYGITDLDKLVEEYKLKRSELEYQIDENKNVLELFTSGGPIWRKMRDSDRGLTDVDIQLISDYHDVRATLARLRDMAPNMDYKTESGEVDVHSTENLADMAGSEFDMKSAGESNYPEVGQNNSLDLSDFFARPIEIATFKIATDASIQKNYEIWDLYTLNPTIRSKLRNYAYFSATLHVRVAISGTPFSYGHIMVSYQPMATANNTLSKLLAAQISFPTMKPLLLNYLSQSEGATIMDIRKNAPVEMSLPFISTKPAVRLFNSSSSVLSANTSYSDLQNFGQLHFLSINPAKSAALTPTSIEIQIIAWATDVKLGTSTGSQMAITTESGDVDEFESGPVERVSSAIARWSGYLERVPYIGRYATASTIMFSSLSKVSAIFGWAKPPVLDEATFVKNMPFSNGAQVIGAETTMRLTLDPKQELTIDPGVVAIKDDQMTIKAIASRESYFDTFTWDTDDAVMAPVWYCRNTPRIETQDIGIAETYWQPTAMSFAAVPFMAWHGSLVYKFRIAASAYHRGKLAFFFEPNIDQNVLINSNLSTNKQFMLIIDIQETQEVEIKVNWAQARMWCYLDSTVRKQYGTTIDLNAIEGCNGYIGVMPFTSLQAPAGAGVYVNVSVSCPDLEVNGLFDRSFPTQRKIRTQSSEVKDTPVSYELNASSADLTPSCLYHFGESIVSFRSLLKRYSTTGRTSLAGTASASGILTYKNNSIPLIDITYGGSITHSSDLFTYLRYAYVGVRGGVRKRVTLHGNLPVASYHTLRVQLAVPAAGLITPSLVYSAGTYPNCSLNGTVVFVPDSNGGYEFEIPFYSLNLFHISFADDLLGSQSGAMVSTWVQGYQVTIDVTDTFGTLVVAEDSAAAEDFSFLRYQGAPYHT